MKEKKKTEKRPPVLKRMLRDLSKIRFPLSGVAAMALVIIACNMISPRLVGGIVGEIGDFVDGGGGKFSALFARIGGPLAWLLGVYAVYSLFSWLKMYTPTFRPAALAPAKWFSNMESSTRAPACRAARAVLSVQLSATT